MKTVQIVTLKPITQEIEYQVVDGGAIVSHGHVIPFDPEEQDTDAKRLALATADATTKGLLA
jgi:hypothetical protein